MKKVLVLCTGNSCRSQIAHGYLAHFAPEGTSIFSAGIETMKADGLDIYESQGFDYVITVCNSAKEKCPYFPSKALKFHHNFYDPYGAEGTNNEIAAVFASVRDEIKSYCKEFVSA